MHETDKRVEKGHGDPLAALTDGSHFYFRVPSPSTDTDERTETNIYNEVPKSQTC